MYNTFLDILGAKLEGKQTFVAGEPHFAFYLEKFIENYIYSVNSNVDANAISNLHIHAN